MVTNLFRDQLDRYGEVTHTLENIKIGIQPQPERHALPERGRFALSTSIHNDFENPVIFFGVNTPIYTSRVEELSDAPYCIRCKQRIRLRLCHLWPPRQLSLPEMRLLPPADRTSAVAKVLSSDAEQSHRCLPHQNEAEYEAKINLPGGYNIYNACAAMAAGQAMGLDAVRRPRSPSPSLPAASVGWKNSRSAARTSA